MKKFFILAGLFSSACATAQLVNNGATIVIQPGASVFCAGSFTNTSGTVTNDGKIEVQGNFANSGTYNSNTSDDSLILSGSGNVTLNSGGATLRNLTINKTANTDLVTLAGSVMVGNRLDYLGGVLSTDYLANPGFAVIAPASAIFSFASGREIIGNVRRTGWANGASIMFNGTNMQLATNSGSAPSELTTTMLPEAFGGDPTQAEREVKRKFLFTSTGGSGFTTDIRFPYLTSELNTNLEGIIVPWSYAAAPTPEWTARLTPVGRDAANDWVSTTGVSATALTQEWKLADPRYTFNVTAYLRGAWNGASLNTNLLSSIPLSHPYNVAPFNYLGSESVGSLPSANIVDWVLVELRKPTSGLAADAASSTIIGRKVGFLFSDGTIKDINGVSPIQFDILKQGAAFITVRHRNHLGVISNAIPSNVTGTFANNFSVIGNVYSDVGIPTPPMALLGGATYGLWAGNASSLDGVINSSDIGLIKSQANAALTGYQIGDVTLDSTVNSSDIGLAKQSANAAATTHSARMLNKPAKTHIPVD